MDYRAGSRRRILPGSGYYSGRWMKAEALNSSCHFAPGGVNGCHFRTVNPRAHMCAHVTPGFLSLPATLCTTTSHRRSSPTGLIPTSEQCFLRPRRRSARLIGPPWSSRMTRGCWEAVREWRQNVSALPRRSKSPQIDLSATPTLK